MKTIKYEDLKDTRRYDDDCKKLIGESNPAFLTAETDGEKFRINFGEDGDYRAHVCRNLKTIPSHYELTKKVKNFLKITDDLNYTTIFEAEEIEIYQAGSFGIIINLKEKDIVIKINANAHISKKFAKRILDERMVDTKAYRYYADEKTDHVDIMRIPIDLLDTTWTYSTWGGIAEIY